MWRSSAEPGGAAETGFGIAAVGTRRGRGDLRMVAAAMDALQSLLWHDGKFLGIEWHLWKVIGWAGNVAFTSRFLVQWYATEKRKEVIVPASFWWLSLAGSWLLLAYAIFSAKNSVFIFANAFNWIPYLRNLVIHRRHLRAHQTCVSCSRMNPPPARFCMQCGAPLVAESGTMTATRGTA